MATVPYGTYYIKREMPLISNLISKISKGEPLITNNLVVNKGDNVSNFLIRLLKKFILSYPVMYVAGHTILLVARKS